ncbi:hypothetical protein FACS1894187_21650 [Synergistales bacterium]|nr:hypothetical protein FACS1894187_21650 [Synergistales bacterium]
MANILHENKQSEMSISKLDPLTRKALDYFVADALKKQQSNILKIVLFGSVARGEENENSDIDVFLLLRKHAGLDADFVESAQDADEFCDYDTFIAPFTLSILEHYEHKKIGIPIIKNIEREGIVLYDAEY